MCITVEKGLYVSQCARSLFTYSFFVSDAVSSCLGTRLGKNRDDFLKNYGKNSSIKVILKEECSLANLCICVPCCARAGMFESVLKGLNCCGYLHTAQVFAVLYGLKGSG